VADADADALLDALPDVELALLPALPELLPHAASVATRATIAARHSNFDEVFISLPFLSSSTIPGWFR
jgi:hypothetical protein